MHFAGWGGHALLGRIAFETLPDWEKKIIKPDMSPEGMAKPFLGDNVKSVGDKTGYYCAILDLVYYDECRPFATLDDGRWIPHSPPDENMQSAVGSGNGHSRKAATDLTEILLGRMIKAIRADNWEDAIRHGGALGHFLQEPFTPGHAVDNNIFHELFPDPDPDRHVRLHHIFDNASDGFEPLAPELMGASIPEAAFRLQVETDRAIHDGKKLIVPVIRSFYKGEPGSARQKLLAPQCRGAAFLTASAWHTAICIALNRFDEEEKRKLEHLELTRLTPCFWHAWQYVELLPGCLVADKRKIPIHVFGKDNTETLVENGFGMGGHMGVKFYVNGDVYRRFRCSVGLPSRHTENQDEHTDCTFYVEMDTKVNKTYSEDIEYGATTLASHRLKPGKPVHEFDVDITGARTLILRAQSKSYIDPETGKVAWSIPHVAVCEPTLQTCDV